MTKNKMVDLAVDYKKVFGSDEGQRVLYDLMKSGFMLSTTFTRDPHESSIREGHRSMILRILSILNTDEKQLRESFNKGLKEDGEYRDSVDVDGTNWTYH